MHLVIADILDASGVARIRTALGSLAFVDGRVTAGTRSSLVKHNTQAEGAGVAMVREFVHDVLMAHPVFCLATRPKAIIGPTFSRYVASQSYGRHIDEPIMAGQRTDVAFTLFLSDPTTYDGGELVIENSTGEDAVKLGAGCLYLYPATTLHRVAPVVSGERLAAVGWVRSFVPRSDHREILFDLGTALHRLSAQQRGHDDVDLLAKSIANLMRLWCDD